MSTDAAVALCNQALRMLGEVSITSFEEGSEISETCNILYPDAMKGLLCSYPWRFSMAKQRLSQLLEKPINEWTYAHTLPPRMLLLRQLFASDGAYAQPLQEYELFEGRIYSHRPALWADYQQETDAATWPPHFIDLAKNALAALFAVAVTGSTTAADLYHRRAYGTPQEAGGGGLMRQARNLDAQQQPPQAITDFPLIAARYGLG